MRPLKPRPPGSIADAVTLIMGALSAEGAGAAVGKSAALVRKWADPDHACVPDANQIMALDAAFRAATGGRGPIGAVIAAAESADGRPVPAHLAKDPHARLAEIMAEVGEVAGDLQRAHADGVLSVRERARLVKDARDAKKSLDRMIGDLCVAPIGKRRVR